jgi:hypothetical protein
LVFVYSHNGNRRVVNKADSVRSDKIQYVTVKLQTAESNNAVFGKRPNGIYTLDGRAERTVDENGYFGKRILIFQTDLKREIVSVYDRINAVFRYYNYAKTENLTITGFPVEQYIESYGSKDSVSEFITELRVPIK